MTWKRCKTEYLIQKGDMRMGDNHYRISEASKKLNVEDHVLRYWEEDLGMDIPRNEMGHRYYTDVHIETFQRIKEMKELGCQLKEIRQKLLEEEMKRCSGIWATRWL